MSGPEKKQDGDPYTRADLAWLERHFFRFGAQQQQKWLPEVRLPGAPGITAAEWFPMSTARSESPKYVRKPRNIDGGKKKTKQTKR